MKRLHGKMLTVNCLTQAQTDRMFELFCLYYENVQRETFNRDLREKHWAILLEDRHTGIIQGFSTLALWTGSVENLPVNILFSGDTIISREYWGEHELGRIWLKHIFGELAPRLRGQKFYWYLLSKGYKTYRFLPAYFYQYYPSPDHPTPEFEQAVMDYFGNCKFPGQYNSQQGVISFEKKRDYLKPDVAAVTHNRLRNPHIRYFQERNPGHCKGDELVCLAELTLENLKPFGHKLLGKGTVVLRDA